MTTPIGYSFSFDGTVNTKLTFDSIKNPDELGGPYTSEFTDSDYALATIKVYTLDQASADFDTWRDIFVMSAQQLVKTGTLVLSNQNDPTGGDKKQGDGEYKLTRNQWIGYSCRTYLLGGGQNKKIVIGSWYVSTISAVDALTVAIGRRQNMEATGVLVYG